MHIQQVNVNTYVEKMSYVSLRFVRSDLKKSFYFKAQNRFTSNFSHV